MLECVLNCTLQHARKYIIYNEQRFENVTKSVETSPEVKLNTLWNQVLADRTLPNNKPDVIISDNELWTSLLIDIGISGARNVIKREAENVLKYTDHKYKHSACGYWKKSDTIVTGGKFNSKCFKTFLNQYAWKALHWTKRAFSEKY